MLPDHGASLLDASGLPVVTRRSLAPLERLAEATGGEVFRADASGALATERAGALAAPGRGARGRLRRAPRARRRRCCRSPRSPSRCCCWKGCPRRARPRRRAPRGARGGARCCLLAAGPLAHGGRAPPAARRARAARARRHRGRRARARAAALATREPALAALAYYHLGVAHLAAGELEEARLAFFDALALDPEDAIARFDLEWTLAALARRPPPQPAAAAERAARAELPQPAPEAPPRREPEPAPGERRERRRPRPRSSGEERRRLLEPRARRPEPRPAPHRAQRPGRRGGARAGARLVTRAAASAALTSAASLRGVVRVVRWCAALPLAARRRSGDADARARAGLSRARAGRPAGGLPGPAAGVAARDPAAPVHDGRRLAGAALLPGLSRRVASRAARAGRRDTGRRRVSGARGGARALSRAAGELVIAGGAPALRRLARARRWRRARRATRVRVSRASRGRAARRTSAAWWERSRVELAARPSRLALGGSTRLEVTLRGDANLWDARDPLAGASGLDGVELFPARPRLELEPGVQLAVRRSFAYDAVPEREGRLVIPDAARPLLRSRAAPLPVRDLAASWRSRWARARRSSAAARAPQPAAGSAASAGAGSRSGRSRALAAGGLLVWMLRRRARGSRGAAILAELEAPGAAEDEAARLARALRLSLEPRLAGSAQRSGRGAAGAAGRRAGRRARARAARAGRALPLRSAGPARAARGGGLPSRRSRTSGPSPELGKRSRSKRSAQRAAGERRRRRGLCPRRIRKTRIGGGWTCSSPRWSARTTARRICDARSRASPRRRCRPIATRSWSSTTPRPMRPAIW